MKAGMLQIIWRLLIHWLLAWSHYDAVGSRIDQRQVPKHDNTVAICLCLLQISIVCAIIRLTRHVGMETLTPRRRQWAHTLLRGSRALVTVKATAMSTSTSTPMPADSGRRVFTFCRHRHRRPNDAAAWERACIDGNERRIRRPLSVGF